MVTKKESNVVSDLNFRYATKKFDPSKKISKEDFNDLLESLRLSPSSFGLEPWKFIVVENNDLRHKIKAAAWNQSQIVDASKLIVLCSKKDISHKDMENFILRVSKERGIDVSNLNGYKEMIMGFRNNVDDKFVADWNKRQVYIAAGFLMSVAANKKIDTCPMEGFNPIEVDKILGLDETGYTSAVILPVGYRAKDDSYANLKKVRYSQKEVVEFKE